MKHQGKIRLCSTDNVPGRRITKWVGYESVAAAVTFSFARDFLAGLRDWWGGRSKTIEQGLRRAEAGLRRELASKAARKGADAVVGVRLALVPYGPRVSILNLHLSGTLVTTSAEVRR